MVSNNACPKTSFLTGCCLSYIVRSFESTSMGVYTKFSTVLFNIFTTVVAAETLSVPTRVLNRLENDFVLIMIRDK